MRLLIFMDESVDPEDLEENDFILVNNLSTYQRLNNDFEVEMLNPTLLDESEDFIKSINLFFKQLPVQFNGLQNETFARFFKPVGALIKQIEDILEDNNITEIILKGGKQYQFITLHGGEGEAKKYSYKSSWLFNSFIHQYFENRITLKWEKSKNKLKAIHFYRDNLQFLKLLVKAIVFSFRNNKIHLKKNLKKLENKNIIFISSIIEYKQLKKISSSQPPLDFIFLNSNSTLSIKEENLDSIFNYASIRFLSFLKSTILFRNLKRLIKPKELVFSFQERELKIKKTSFLLAIKANFIKNNAHYLELISILSVYQKNDKSLFFTGKTFGDDIVLINKLSNKLSIWHLNFQLVTMAKVLLPQMELANQFFLYSKKTYDFYKKYSKSYKYFLPLTTKEREKITETKDKITLTVFTQPDMNTDRYLTLLKDILPIINKRMHNCIVKIKPHYRQDYLSSFKDISDKYDFVKLIDNLKSPEEIMNTSDFMLSMTSAVLFEAIMLNCPGLIADFDGFNTEWILNNDVCYPEVNFLVKTPEEVLAILQSKDEFIEKYEKRRNKWINDNEGILVSDIFSKI